MGNGGAHKFKALVSIVNWNTREMLRECLASLEGLDKVVDCAVVVVDNDSSDGSAAMAREEFPWARLIANNFNGGFAKGNNQAFDAVDSEYTLVLNPDTSVPHETVLHLLKLLEERRDVGIATPMLVGTDGLIQHYYYKLFTPKIFVIRNTILEKLRPFKRIVRDYLMLDCEFRESMEIEQASASCILVRNSALGGEKLFDERFPIFFNDVDLCKRIIGSGGKVYYTKDASIKHYGGESLKQLGGEFDAKYFAGAAAYVDKHYGRGTLAACAAAMFALWAAWAPFLFLEVALSPKKKAVKLNRQASRIRILTAALLRGGGVPEGADV